MEMPCSTTDPPAPALSQPHRSTSDRWRVVHLPVHWAVPASPRLHHPTAARLPQSPLHLYDWWWGISHVWWGDRWTFFFWLPNLRPCWRAVAVAVEPHSDGSPAREEGQLWRCDNCRSGHLPTGRVYRRRIVHLGLPTLWKCHLAVRTRPAATLEGSLRHHLQEILYCHRGVVNGRKLGFIICIHFHSTLKGAWEANWVLNVYNIDNIPKCSTLMVFGFALIRPQVRLV